MQILAKETTYKGILFRSRLEAQAAYYFDTLWLDWEYEPHMIKLSNGETYVPDFYLRKLQMYVEVKGGHNERVEKFEQFKKDRKKELITPAGRDGYVRRLLMSHYRLHLDEGDRRDAVRALDRNGVPALTDDEIQKYIDESDGQLVDFISSYSPQDFMLRDTGFPEEIWYGVCSVCGIPRLYDYTDRIICPICSAQDEYGEHDYTYINGEHKESGRLTREFLSIRNMSARYDRPIGG